MPPGQTISRPSMPIDPKEEGLVDGWNLGDPVNGLVLGAKGNNLTVTGGPVAELTPLGMGMRFDGVNDYCVTVGNVNWAANAAKSIELWCNVAAAGNKTVIWQGGTNPIYLYLGGVSLQSFMNGTQFIFGNVTAGVWLHMVWIYTGTEERMYINGVQLGAANVEAAPAQNSAIYIGATGAIEFVNGLILNPKVYSRALTESEIRTHYAQGKTAMWATRHSDISVDPVALGGVVGQYL